MNTYGGTGGLAEMSSGTQYYSKKAMTAPKKQKTSCKGGGKVACKTKGKGKK